MDFTDRLRDEVETLELEIPLRLGLLDEVDSLAFYCTGGHTLQTYYDGTETKQLNYEFSIKTKNQGLANQTLSQVASFLVELDTVPSNNESYTFERLEIVNEPFFVGQDEQKYIWYRLAIQVRLTIFKKEKEMF